MIDISTFCVLRAGNGAGYGPYLLSVGDHERLLAPIGTLDEVAVDLGIGGIAICGGAGSGGTLAAA